LFKPKAGRIFVERNIYRIDDYCLRIAYILAAIAAITLLAFLTKATTTRFVFLLFWSFSAAILFFVGYAYRTTENTLARLTDIIVSEGSIGLSDLSQRAEVPLGKLRKLVAEIEKYNHPLIKLEKDRVGLFIGGSVDISNQCHSCGASSSHRIQLTSPVPQCSYCGAPVDGEKIAMAKEELYDRARLLCAQQTSARKILSVPLLIFLVILFPPAALIYLFICALPRQIRALQTSVYNQHIAQSKTKGSPQTSNPKSSPHSN
jgi:hypothetical protein